MGLKYTVVCHAHDRDAPTLGDEYGGGFIIRVVVVFSSLLLTQNSYLVPVAILSRLLKYYGGERGGR